MNKQTQKDNLTMPQLKTVTVLQESGKFLHVNRSISDSLNLKVLASDVFNVLFFSLLKGISHCSCF